MGQNLLEIKQKSSGPIGQLIRHKATKGCNTPQETEKFSVFSFVYFTARTNVYNEKSIKENKCLTDGFVQKALYKALSRDISMIN